MKWIITEPNGLVICCGETDEIPQEAIAASFQEDFASIIKKYWWDGIELLPKQHFTIDAIPLPATAEIEGVQYPITENPVIFGFDTPGTYTVRVDAGPAYYVEEFTVDYSA